MPTSRAIVFSPMFSLPEAYKGSGGLALLMVLAAALGYVGWGGGMTALAFTPLVVCLWARAGSRRASFLVMASYYLMAGRALLSGAAIFFTDPDGSRSLLSGVVVWSAPNLLLAGTWAAVWGVTRRPLRALAALFLVSVPPVGLVGWMNPLTAAGAVFPATGWIGLVLTGVLMSMLASPRYVRPALLASLLLSAGAHLVHEPAAPARHWVAIDTNLGSGRDPALAFDRLQALQAKVRQASEKAPAGTTFLLPELVGGDWAAEEAWWRRTNDMLRMRGQGAFLGSYAYERKDQKVSNLMVGLGMASDVRMRGRVPVPFSMWRPWSDEGTVAEWFAAGHVHDGAQRVGYVICYEQILIWPVLVSMGASPEVLIGAANDWWAKGTNGPMIQYQAMTAWSRLFHVPLVSALNL